MPLKFNLRHLEQKNLSLRGELSPAELDLENIDELIQIQNPLKYDLEVQKLDDAVLVQGALSLKLSCECARCLKPYEHEIFLENWASHLALKGDESVEVANDLVDLTPYIREDILLSFPQHPLCEPECKGLRGADKGLAQAGLGESPAGRAARSDGNATSSTWAELNKLKF